MQSTLLTTRNGSVGSFETKLADVERLLKCRSAQNNANSTCRLSILTPSNYLTAAALADQQSQNMDEDDYRCYRDFIDQVRRSLNALATNVKATASERVFLSALVDLLSLRPRAVVAGNLSVRFSARDAASYVGLSASTCTIVRKSLSEKGIIAIDGDIADLAPLIDTMRPIMSAGPISEQLANVGELVFAGGVPESGKALSNVKVSSEKKTFTFADPGNLKAPDDLFSEASLKDAIALSPKLVAVLDEELGEDHKAVPVEVIVDHMDTVVERVLSDEKGQFRYKGRWGQCWKAFGYKAFALIVAALEGKPVKGPGRWFFGMTKRASAGEVDLCSNIHAIVEARRMEREREAEKQRLAKLREDQATDAARQHEAAQRAKRLLDKVLAKTQMAEDPFFYQTIADRIQVKVSGDEQIFALRRYNNPERDRRFVSIVKAMIDQLEDVKGSFIDRTFAAISPIGALRTA